jgi:hypothetical protein
MATAFVSNEKVFAEEMGWYPMLHIAAQEGYLNIGGHKSVINSPALEFLFFVNYYKRKSELDAERIKRDANQ